MSFINLANKSFTKHKEEIKQKRIDESKMSIQDIDNKINECKQNLTNIKTKVNEIHTTWKALKEDYQMMSFAKCFDTTVKESMQSAIDKLKIEFDDAKNTLNFYKDLKNKTLLEADVTVSKDDMFDPSSISLSRMAKQASDKEKAEKAAQELERKRQEYKEKASGILSAVEDSVERGDDVSETVEILFNELVPDYGKADTVAGEIIRAIMRIMYRDYNDGDVFFKGYGLETCAASAQYLINTVGDGLLYDDFYDIIENDLEDDNYTKAIENIASTIVNYLLENVELMFEPNTKDSRNTDTSELEDNQPRYELAIEMPEELSYHISAEHINEGDVEDYLSQYSGDYPSLDYRNIRVTYYGEVIIDNLEWDDFQTLDNGQLYKILEAYAQELDEEYPDDEDEEADIDESMHFVESLNKMIKTGNTLNLNKICSILEKYGDDNSDVSDNFKKASKKEKEELKRLVK